MTSGYCANPKPPTIAREFACGNLQPREAYGYNQHDYHQYYESQESFLVFLLLIFRFIGHFGAAAASETAGQSPLIGCLVQSRGGRDQGAPRRS